MSKRIEDLFSIAFIIVVVTAALSGCGTYNHWTPRTEPVTRYSCDDGYYDCTLRTSNQAGDHGKASRGPK